jgi:secondary thiamine-phosphate synthase enzyme
MSSPLAPLTPRLGPRPQARHPVPLRHRLLHLATSHGTEFIDITDRVRDFVAAADIETGLVTVQSLHTTLGVVVNEHEPLLLADFVRQLEQWAPADGSYAHDDPARRRVNLVPGERVNGHAHCRALALGVSVTLGIADGELLLGRWQRVFVVELDGAQNRRVAMTVVGGRS